MNTLNSSRFFFLLLGTLYNEIVNYAETEPGNKQSGTKPLHGVLYITIVYCIHHCVLCTYYKYDEEIKKQYPLMVFFFNVRFRYFDLFMVVLLNKYPSSKNQNVLKKKYAILQSHLQCQDQIADARDFKFWSAGPKHIQIRLNCALWKLCHFMNWLNLFASSYTETAADKYKTFIFDWKTLKNIFYESKNVRFACKFSINFNLFMSVALLTRVCCSSKQLVLIRCWCPLTSKLLQYNAMHVVF